MKAFRFYGMVLLTILMSVGFAACSSDDDGNDDNNDKTNVPNLYGLWERSSSEMKLITTKGITDITEDGSWRLRFSEDGTVTKFYTYSGPCVAGEGCNSETSYKRGNTYNYSLKGDKLYIENLYGDGNDVIFTVKSLNVSQLIIESTYTQIDESGEKYEYYRKETYKKIDR